MNTTSRADALMSTKVVSPRRVRFAHNNPHPSPHSDHYYTQGSPSPSGTRTNIKPILHNTNVASTKRHHSSSNHMLCVNHQNRPAAFRIVVDESLMIYCEKCAAHLASNGFRIEKIDRTHKYPGSNEVFSQRNHRGKARMEEIEVFLDSARTTESKLKVNYEIFVDLERHYMEQEDLVEDFYNGMIVYISTIKATHIKTLREEKNRNLLNSSTEIRSSEFLIPKVREIIEDVESQVAGIVKNLNDDLFRNCFNKLYKQLDSYNCALKAQNEFIQGVTNMDGKELETKLCEFKCNVDRVLGLRPSKILSGASEQFSFDNNEEFPGPPAESPCFKVI